MRSTLGAVSSRLAYGIPVLFIVTFGAAALTDLMPGSPAQAILGETATADQIAELNARFGYDRPLVERYFDWLTSALQGNLGLTLFTQEPVLDVLLRRLVVTLELTLIALVISLVASIVLALCTTARQGGWLDKSLNSVTSVLLSMPSFVTAVALSLVFSVWLGLLPATGWVPISDGLFENLRYAILPALALATYEFAFFYRVLRSELASTLKEDFVLVARAKGLSTPRVIFRHGLKPSLTSLITVLGLAIGRLLGGAVIVEFFFSVPGIGAEAIAAVASKDMGMLQAIVAFGVVAYVVIFILVDLAYAWVDPRVTVR